MSRAVTILRVALLCAACAAQPLRRVAFPKFSGTPSGWERYDPHNLSGNTAIGYVDATVPLELRSHVKGAAGFSYSLSVPPGAYRARLGFLEKKPCKPGKRVFRFHVNGVHTDDIDIYAATAACKTPHFVDVGPFRADDGLITLAAVNIEGKWAPILSNFEITQSDADAAPTVSPNSVTPASPAPPAVSGTSSPSPSSSSPSQLPPPPPPGEPSAASDPIRVSFAKYGPPSGWALYDAQGLSQGVAIAGAPAASGPKEYRNHAKKGGGFVYTHRAASGTYNVKLGFLETSSKACVNGKRVFKARVHGTETGDVDVFKAVGCNVPLDVDIGLVQVAPDEETLTIELFPVAGFAPFLANFVATPHSVDVAPSATASPSASLALAPPPVPAPPAAETDITVNAGLTNEKDAPPGSSGFFFAGAITKASGALAPLNFYKTARYGKDFSYSFKLEPGAYDVTLGFIENYGRNCMPGRRVFNVYVNGAIQLEGYDIYAAVGCFHGHEEVLAKQTIGSVENKPLMIRFEAVSNNAHVSYIRVKSAAEQCVPESATGELLSDHAAHAVPGSYPPQGAPNAATSYVDSDGDGFVAVHIDGKGSHTHFFDSQNNIIGRITEYTWSLAESGEVISKKQAFTHKFPLGTTRLKLAVVDNSCTRDEAETTVTVTGKRQPGQYCYYYAGVAEAPMGGTLLGSPRPSFAHASSSVDLGFPPFAFDQEQFAVRCQFFLENEEEGESSQASEISVDTAGSGVAKVYKGEDLILDTTTSSSAVTALAQGLTFFEVVYVRSGSGSGSAEDGAAAKLSFMVNGAVPADRKISHDRTTVVPVLAGLSPREGQVSGGTKVKVTGYGLFQPLRVSFGGVAVEVLKGGASGTQFFVESPALASGEALSVEVVATTGTGLASNAVVFEYGTSCDSVGFDEGELVRVERDENGVERESGLDVKLPTCVVIGGDGKLYMGTLGGTVQVVGYDGETLVATSHCWSEALVDEAWRKDGRPAVRDILGITLDPRDNPPRPYVSASTLYWRERGTIDADNTGAWRNGAVEVLRPVGGTETGAEAGGVCLEHERQVVSGLPVSNHDHGVNGLLFTQDGDLLIAVGGMTNSGLPGYKLGGTWETPLSAAVLVAATSKQLRGEPFDGAVRYSTPHNPRTARVVAGDVAVYAAGLRNAFALAMTRDAHVFTTDQGPNCQFGDTASACDEFDEVAAAAWHANGSAETTDWPGRVRHGWRACPFGPGRRDKLLRLQRGAFFGHPNLQRARAADSDIDECAWIDPYTGTTAAGGPPPARYRPPLAILDSAATGVLQYAAAHFCAALRGDLLVSTYKGGTTWRLRLAPNASAVTSGPDALTPHGGLSLAEDAAGRLVFPLLASRGVRVLQPRVRPRGALRALGAAPARHGREGGSLLRVAGERLAPAAAVRVGGRDCPVKTRHADREIVCVVPPASDQHAGTAVDVEVAAGEERSVLPAAVLYMRV